MEYLDTYKDYKIYQQKDLFYAIKSIGKEIVGDQISYKGMKKFVAPTLKDLYNFLDNERKPSKPKFIQTDLF
jgi:hypothetical protein